MFKFYLVKNFNFRYKYPLNDNIRENEAEDIRCLATVEEHIENQTKLGAPVAGMIVEPIQAEGGDYHGSKEFFQVNYISFSILLLKNGFILLFPFCNNVKCFISS